MRSPALILCCSLLLNGCAKPDWIRAPDFSSWFDNEHAIEVREVVRSEVCGTVGGESDVTVMPDLTALKAWAAARHVALVTAADQVLQAQPYAIVEFGQRPNSGYGLAVSRRAGMRDDVLLLKATFFEPQQGRWASDTPSSPCVIVSLPPRDYSVVKLIDQTGKVRAASEGRGS